MQYSTPFYFYNGLPIHKSYTWIFFFIIGQFSNFLAKIFKKINMWTFEQIPDIKLPMYLLNITLTSSI